MAKILVTGSNGQVGNEIQALALNYPTLKFSFVDINDLDITNADEVYEFVNKNEFQYIINCAAYTAVDNAEDNKEIAYKVNVLGAKNLAQASIPRNVQLIHLSTDYVYHNDINRPLLETDPTNPQSVYAATKLEGDEIVQTLLPSAMIIRISWVYSSFRHNFVKTMLKLGRERDSLGIVYDQIGTPTYAHDLAGAMLEIINKNEKGDLDSGKMSGIFHYSNEGVTSWYDFATAIFKLEDISCKVSPIETKDYPTPAARPPFSLLNKGKIKHTFGIEIPHWETSLKSCLDALKAND